MQPHIIQVSSVKPRPKRKFRAFFIELLKFLGIFTFFLAISGAIIMGPVIYTKIAYYFDNSSSTATNNQQQLPVSSVDYKSIAPIVESRTLPIPQDARLVVPKIKVDVPIIFMQSSKNEDILEAIKNGVAHFVGTAMPGRIGNMFITGHSSYYWWSGGKYNQVFALLPQLKANDLIYVYYKGAEYVYQVKDSIVVKPTQIEVLDQTIIPTLSLMTCVPIGTNLKRLIVRADLISAPPIDLGKLHQFLNIPKIPTILPL